MKIFVIHSRANKEAVAHEVTDISNRTVGSEVVMLDDAGPFWRSVARKMIKQAQMVLVYVGEHSYGGHNVAWEINMAKKYHKSIYTVLLSPDNQLPKALFAKNKYTKEKENVSAIKSKEDIIAIINTYSAGDYSLFNKETNELDKSTLLEQYKVFLQTSETLVERRQNVNNFYITVNSALIACFGTISALSFQSIIKCFMGIVFLVIGIVLCLSWIRILKSYGILNSSKMKIISLIEKQLPASMYDAEWRAQSDRLNRQPYVSFTKCETRIPKIFICIYAAIALFTIAFAIVRASTP